MKYQREIHFTLHDYKTKKGDEKWMDKFLKIHEKLESKFYIDTLRELIATYEKVIANSVDISIPPSFYDDKGENKRV